MSDQLRINKREMHITIIFRAYSSIEAFDFEEIRTSRISSSKSAKANPLRKHSDFRVCDIDESG